MRRRRRGAVGRAAWRRPVSPAPGAADSVQQAARGRPGRSGTMPWAQGGDEYRSTDKTRMIWVASVRFYFTYLTPGYKPLSWHRASSPLRSRRLRGRVHRPQPAPAPAATSVRARLSALSPPNPPRAARRSARSTARLCPDARFPGPGSPGFRRPAAAAPRAARGLVMLFVHPSDRLAGAQIVERELRYAGAAPSTAHRPDRSRRGAARASATPLRGPQIVAGFDDGRQAAEPPLLYRARPSNRTDRLAPSGVRLTASRSLPRTVVGHKALVTPDALDRFSPTWRDERLSRRSSRSTSCSAPTPPPTGRWRSRPHPRAQLRDQHHRRHACGCAPREGGWMGLVSFDVQLAGRGSTSTRRSPTQLALALARRCRSSFCGTTATR